MILLKLNCFAHTHNTSPEGQGKGSGAVYNNQVKIDKKKCAKYVIYTQLFAVLRFLACLSDHIHSACSSIFNFFGNFFFFLSSSMHSIIFDFSFLFNTFLFFRLRFYLFLVCSVLLLILLSY